MTTQRVLRRKRYAVTDVKNALTFIDEGNSVMDAYRMFGVPERTLRRMLKRKREGEIVKKPGPNPILTLDNERDLVDWVIAMQKQGLPVTRFMVLEKANEIFHELYGGTRSVGKLSESWLNKLMLRHPHLSLRSSQVIQRCRNEASFDGLNTFCNELIKHVIEQTLSADRIFNMDETGNILLHKDIDNKYKQ